MYKHVCTTVTINVKMSLFITSDKIYSNTNTTTLHHHFLLTLNGCLSSIELFPLALLHLHESLRHHDVLRQHPLVRRETIEAPIRSSTFLHHKLIKVLLSFNFVDQSALLAWLHVGPGRLASLLAVSDQDPGAEAGLPAGALAACGSHVAAQIFEAQLCLFALNEVFMTFSATI